MGKRLPGVFPAQKKDGTEYYRASITHKRKHISLGSYDTPYKAFAAYLEGSNLLKDTQLTILDHSSHRVLPFEKWVTLINFRDNGMYIATPIYLHKKYFEYYLSHTQILKFDIDDLFYYSSRKIMQRGRHFFVADYGMQVNIVSRYGIKNYAVEGKDYRFVNGDNLDFRYENIEIYNVYNGVSKKETAKGTLYAAKIHIRGNYTIGNYHTETEAAIAYNKAIDILKKAGVTKNFVPNYLDGLSPKAYADIYSDLKISPKILNYQVNE
ncbi:MAG: hypothetical protein IKY23_00395 [Lachnospiraceae bacterium]|nr:hypothetical protein [Lachnospiraceae bacterium]